MVRQNCDGKLSVKLSSDSIVSVLHILGEGRYFGHGKEYEMNMGSLVKRDRNHASVVIWSYASTKIIHSCCAYCHAPYTSYCIQKEHSLQASLPPGIAMKVVADQLEVMLETPV
jgi:hypothetical protein